MSTTLTVAVGLGIGCGLGVTATLRALVGGPVALDASLRRLDDVGISVAGLRSGERRPSRMAQRTARLGSLGRGPKATDLAVADRSIERFGIEKLVCAVVLGALPLAVASVLVVGGLSLPPAVLLLACLGGAAGGFTLPDLTLRSRARERRYAFRHALSAYLDLVNVLLAGGAGVETALSAAAEAGDGWVFDTLRDTLVRARTSRTSPWAAFDELGRRLDVRELVELSASIELAGEQGARIRLSLVAKAEAMQGRQSSEIEARAHAATERMGLPTVLMFVGFLVLLGYPAAVTVSGGIGG